MNLYVGTSKFCFEYRVLPSWKCLSSIVIQSEKNIAVYDIFVLRKRSTAPQYG